MKCAYLSPSRIDVIEGCPYRYWHQYDQKTPLSNRFNESLVFGSFVHKTLELLAKEPSKKNIDKYLKIAMEELPMNIPLPMLNRARETLEQWYDDKKFESVEYTEYATPKGYLIGDVPIYAIVDKIQITPEKIIITDYKTGKFFYDHEETRNSTQLLFYALLVRELLDKDTPITIQYDMINHNSVVSYSPTDEEIDQMREYLPLVWNKVQTMDAVAQPSWKCGWCPYRGSCESYKSWLVEDDIEELPDDIESIPIDRLINTIQTLKDRSKICENKAKELEHSLMGAMQKNGRLEIERDGYAIKISSNLRHNYDTEKVLGVLPKEYYARVFSVSVTAINNIISQLPDEKKAELLLCDQVSHTKPFLRIKKIKQKMGQKKEEQGGE